jgi:hypothetical protein
MVVFALCPLELTVVELSSDETLWTSKMLETRGKPDPLSVKSSTVLPRMDSANFRPFSSLHRSLHTSLELTATDSWS